MAMKIRLARGGSKKRPFYRVVAADSRSPRDGRYIEKLGTYNPLLPKDSEERIKLDMERVQYWLGEGATPTDRVSRFLEAAGVVAKQERNNPNKGTPGKKAVERAEEKVGKAASAAEAAAAPAAVEKAPAEDVVAEEAPAEEVAAKEAPAEDVAADEAPTEELAAEEAPAEEAPAEDVTADEAPTEEVAAKEAPAEEAPAEEVAAEEAPAEKAKAE